MGWASAVALAASLLFATDRTNAPAPDACEGRWERTWEALEEAPRRRAALLCVHACPAGPRRGDCLLETGRYLAAARSYDASDDHAGAARALEAALGLGTAEEEFVIPSTPTPLGPLLLRLNRHRRSLGPGGIVSAAASLMRHGYLDPGREELLGVVRRSPGLEAAQHACAYLVASYRQSADSAGFERAAEQCDPLIPRICPSHHCSSPLALAPHIYHFRAAQEAVTQGDDLRAAREFERTVELFSRDAEFLPYALRYAGRSWARSGRPDRARAACIRLLRDHPRSKEAQALAAASPSSPLRECVIVR